MQFFFAVVRAQSPQRWRRNNRVVRAAPGGHRAWRGGMPHPLSSYLRGLEARAPRARRDGAPPIFLSSRARSLSSRARSPRSQGEAGRRTPYLPIFAGWKPALPGRGGTPHPYLPIFAGWKPALPGRSGTLPVIFMPIITKSLCPCVPVSLCPCVPVSLCPLHEDSFCRARPRKHGCRGAGVGVESGALPHRLQSANLQSATPPIRGASPSASFQSTAPHHPRASNPRPNKR